MSYQWFDLRASPARFPPRRLHVASLLMSFTAKRSKEMKRNGGRRWSTGSLFTSYLRQTGEG